MSTLKSYFEQVAAAFQNQPALWTPGWWYLTINKAVEMAKGESLATDMFHYENLKILIHKISRAWSNCSSRSEITSLESLYQKIGHLLVLTFQTSLSSQIIENVMCYISISVNKDSYSVETCLDSALMTIMSTSSIPAPLVAPSASAGGGKRSRAGNSDQDTSTEASSESGDDETFSVQSYISSSVKGVAKNRGLKEDVKDWRIIVSTSMHLVYILYPNCTLLLTVKGVQWQEVEKEVGKLLGPLEDTLGHDLRRGEPDEEFSGPSSGKRKRRDGYQEMEKNQKGRFSKWQVISGKIHALLERTAICPLEGIKSEACFLNDDFLTDPDNSNKVNEAIKLWSYKINDFTLKQYFDMYNTNSKEDLIFSRSKVYYSIEDSTNILDKLLIHQFDDDESEVKDFLQHLVNVVDRQPEDRPFSNIKCNTFLVHSPPSAGKNFFFDTLFTLCLNLGQLGTANKSNNFAFQDAANRRIILWNEPNYESGMTDYLKTLFEGGDTKVRVKMMGDTHVKRTPIIILTNNHVNFMSDTAFKDRIKQYKWKTAPFLKECLLKPHPLSFFEILLKYEIKF